MNLSSEHEHLLRLIYKEAKMTTTPVEEFIIKEKFESYYPDRWVACWMELGSKGAKLIRNGDGVAAHNGNSHLIHLTVEGIKYISEVEDRQESKNRNDKILSFHQTALCWQIISGLGTLLGFIVGLLVR